ncbi:organic cation transporter protein-like [Macrobrachium rosenbergii]|uniref:organic cation transporter protein-like n=1 Tax=Macrobrachium rosenbergii TaxID=79674 RepID=UPI0034D5D15D
MSAGEDGFDDLLATIGFGRWQTVIISATLLVAAQIPIHQVGSPFISAPMPFRCFPSPPSEEPPDALSLWKVSDVNDTYYNSKCLEVPMDVNEDNVSTSYNGTTYFTGLPTCPYVAYDTSIFTSTINSEWHIVCEHEYLRPLYQMVYNAGALIGCLVCGHIGDKWGRKSSVMIGSIFHLIAVILMATVPSYAVILTMRFIIGVMTSIMLLPAWSLALEVSPAKHRSLVGMLMGLPYSFFTAANAGVAYFLRTWKYILLVGICPGVILLPLAFFINESPRWLIQKGREEEAVQALNRAVKLNKTELSVPLETTVRKLSQAVASGESGGAPEDKDKKTLRSQVEMLLRYIRSPAMRLILLLTPPLWFTQSFLYLSIAINANNFTTSGPFLYMALTGAMDGSAIILTTPLATRLGRKTMVSGGLFFGASLFLAEQFVPADFGWAKWVLVMVGFLLIGSAFQVNFIYGPELFPTEVRTRGFGFLNLVSQAGFVCTPVAKHAWWAGGVLFGISGMLGALTVLPLPETKNRPLPETLQDAENRMKKSESKSKDNS